MKARVESGKRAPAIVLVKPQLGENIGFAARAMANFGLSDLRLVAPRDGWPNDKAHAAAAGAAYVVEQARVYPTVEQAIAELNYVLAATARPREMVKTVLAPESAALELKERARRGELTGVSVRARAERPRQRHRSRSPTPFSPRRSILISPRSACRRPCCCSAMNG